MNDFITQKFDAEKQKNFSWKWTVNFLLIVCVYIVASCGAEEKKSNLSIACAANMQYAMDSIVSLFEAEEGIHCEITAGSSGMLATQIENGAPYDIFVSADLSYPQTIFDNGNGDAPFIYAKGRLVLVVSKNSNYNSIEQALTDLNISRIGIADIRLAPYGKAADEFLVKIGLKDSIASRIVIGESIGQINQYITTGAVDAAFTSYSFRVENEDQFKYFEVDQSTFAPIEQGAMILDYGKENNPDEVEKFRKFFESEKCKAVLNYFGYLVD